RVDQHEIVLPLLRREHRDRILLEHRRAQAKLVEVPLDRVYGVAFVVDEDHLRRAARQRLETHPARAGVEIEDDSAVHGADDVEDVLAHAVRGRPRVPPGRRMDGVALPRSRDDAHPVPTYSETVPLRRNRDFLLLQSGQLLSNVGTQSTQIVYPLLVLALT